MMRMVQALAAVVLVGGMCSCVRFRLNPWARPAKEAAATEVATAAVAPVPEAAIVVPSPTLICKRTPAPIVVDGRREVLWDHGIAVTRFFVPPGCTEPLSKTEVSCLWDDKALYVLFQAQDKDVWSDLLEHDDSTYLNDVLEFFIAYGDFDDELQYVNFEVNALGTVYDAHSPVWPLRNLGHRWKRWNCLDLKVAVTVQGTLNDYRDEDQGWTLEMAIPFSSLPWMQDRAQPRIGEEWRGHFARWDYSVYLPEGKEISSTTPFTRVNFHQADKFQRLYFQR
jgi:hypothetical protein